MITNNFNFTRSNTMDIEKKSNNKALIKIPLEAGGFWEKEYLQDDLIEKVVQDYKIENNIDLPQEYFLEWYFKNKSIKMTDKIKNLINQEVPTICINQVIIKSPLQISNEENISDIIGKPFNNPFEIFLFTKEDKSLKIQTYDPITINNYSLNNFSPSSAYCNGNNHLFISGGENKNGEIIDDFWEIDLKTQNISEPVKIPPKKNHSMIFIPNYYIFIVGGNDKKTFYFNIENKEIDEWADLNKIRIEPALQKIGNYLYCFDCVNNGNNDIFSLERTNLFYNEPEWILLAPKFNFPIDDEQKLSQKFFGVSKDEEDNIIFLGGNMDNYNINEIFNYKYNINLNTIEISKVPYRRYNFKEKTFLTYKRNIEYILPDFNKQHPEVVFFLKKNNRMEAIDYEPKLNSQLNQLKAPISDYKYDFNMPTVTIPEQFTNLSSQNKINTYQPNNFNSTIKMDINRPPFKDFNYKNQIINHNIEDNFLDNNNKMELQTNFKEPEIEPTKEDIKLSLEINKSLIKSKDKLLFKNNDDNLKINTNLNNIEFNKLKNSNIQNEYPYTDIHNSKLFFKDNNSENDLNINEYNNNIKTPSKIEKPQIISQNNSNNSSGMNSIKYNNDNKNDDSVNDLENLQQNSQNIKLLSKNDIKSTDNNTIIDFKKDVFLIGTIYGTKSKQNENENKNIFCISGHIPGIKEKKTKKDLNNPNGNINSKVKMDLNKNNIKDNNVDMNENIREINANEPKINIKTSNLHIKNPNYRLSGNIPSYNNINRKNQDIPLTNIKYNYKKMPDYKLNGSFHGKTIDVSSTNSHLKNQYNYNINNDKPDIEIESPKIDLPSGKISSKSKIPYNSLNGNKINKLNTNNSFNSKKKKEDYFMISGIIKGKKSLKKARNLSSNNSRKNSNNDIFGNSSNKDANNLKINMPQINMNKNESNKNFYMAGIINGTKDKAKKEEIPSGKINLNGQNLNISGNISENNSNIPKININQDNVKIKEESKIDTSNYDIKPNIYKTKIIEPKIDLNEPNLEFHLDGPKINANNYIENKDQLNINLPKANLCPPKIELIGPETNIKENIDNNNEIKITKVEMQNSSSNINIKDLKMHDSNDLILFKGIDLNNSNININKPYETLNINNNKKEDCNISGVIHGINNMNNNPNLNSKDLNISGTIHGINLNPPKVLSPKININFHNSNIKNNNEIGNQNIQLSSSQMKVTKISANEINQNLNINKEISLKANQLKTELYNENLNINPLAAEFGSENRNIKNQKLNEIPNYNIYGNIPNVKVTKLSPSKSDKDFLIERKIPSSSINNNKINLNFQNSNPDIQLLKKNNNLEELNSINKNFNKSMNELNYNYYKEITLPRNIINSYNEMNNNKINLNNKNIKDNKIINNPNINNYQKILEISNNEIYPAQINYNYNNINNIPNLNLQNNLENKNIYQQNSINEQYDINDNNIDINIPRIEINNSNNLEMERNDIIQKQYDYNDKLKDMEEENNENDNVNIGEGINYYDIRPIIRRDNSKKKNKDLPLVGIKNNKFKSSKIESVGRLNTENIDINNLKPANIGINGIKIGDRIIQ